MSSEPNDPELLTPGHFLMGTCPNRLPEVSTSRNQYEELSTRTKNAQSVRSQWTREYLNQIQTVSKWKYGGTQPQVDDLAQVAENNTTPSTPYGKDT